jgi:hypothetical protein
MGHGSVRRQTQKDQEKKAKTVSKDFDEHRLPVYLEIGIYGFFACIPALGIFHIRHPNKMNVRWIVQ